MMLTKALEKRIFILFCLIPTLFFCIFFSDIIMNIDSNSSKLRTSEKLIFEEEAVFGYLNLTKSYLEQ